MEPVLINKLKHTKEIFIEMNKTYSKASRTAISIIIFTFYLILALSLYFLCYETFSAVLLFVFGTVLSVYPTGRLYIFARKREKQLLELYDSVPECETLFYDDHLFSVGITSKEELNIKYTKIKKIKQSKNLYLLILGNKVVVMVDKNRFEKGNCEEFEKFIKEKAVNAKIKL